MAFEDYIDRIPNIASSVNDYEQILAATFSVSSKVVHNAVQSSLLFGKEECWERKLFHLEEANNKCGQSHHQVTLQDSLHAFHRIEGGIIVSPGIDSDQTFCRIFRWYTKCIIALITECSG